MGARAAAIQIDFTLQEDPARRYLEAIRQPVQRFENADQNALDIGECIIVPESQHVIALALEPSRARCIGT
jgi:hypothetical protein